MAVHYLETIRRDVDEQCSTAEGLHGLSFGFVRWPISARPGSQTIRAGLVVGVRAPLSGHEQPIIRAYLAVDIAAAVEQA